MVQRLNLARHCFDQGWVGVPKCKWQSQPQSPGIRVLRYPKRGIQRPVPSEREFLCSPVMPQNLHVHLRINRNRSFSLIGSADIDFKLPQDMLKPRSPKTCVLDT